MEDEKGDDLIKVQQKMHYHICNNNCTNLLCVFFFQKLNISFQDLGDPYQVENFNRILRRLIRVETLWLVDNSLIDLSAIRLPR